MSDELFVKATQVDLHQTTGHLFTAQLPPLPPGARQDARILSMLAPYLLADQNLLILVPHKSGQLIRTPRGLYKVRAVTAEGIGFGPSVAKGAGREHTEENWAEAMEGLTGFLVFDAVESARTEELRFVPVDAGQVDKWRVLGAIGKTGEMERWRIIKAIKLGIF